MAAPGGRDECRITDWRRCLARMITPLPGMDVPIPGDDPSFCFGLSCDAVLAMQADPGGSSGDPTSVRRVNLKQDGSAVPAGGASMTPWLAVVLAVIRRDGRTELQVLLDFVQHGDTLVVTRIDRLARSMRDLQDIVHELKERGVALRATEQPVDTTTAAGKAFLDMLGVFAEFETNLRRERQLEGIAAAKSRGVYKGRKATVDVTEIRRLSDVEMLGATAIARRLGIGRSSVYRGLAEVAKPPDGGTEFPS